MFVSVFSGDDAVEAHSRVDTDNKVSLDEQYTTVDVT